MYFQGAKLDPFTGNVEQASIKPWRTHVGPFAGAGEEVLNDDQSTLVRFLLVFNRQSLTQTITVERVNISFLPR